MILKLNGIVIMKRKIKFIFEVNSFQEKEIQANIFYIFFTELKKIIIFLNVDKYSLSKHTINCDMNTHFYIMFCNIYIYFLTKKASQLSIYPKTVTLSSETSQTNRHTRFK